jgi:formamidopyrimidine-DNA glycosylase
MPELAEVEFFRKRWHQAAVGRRIVAVELNARSRVFRGVDTQLLARSITGEKLTCSSAAAKQMLFQFSGDLWLGLHLGMTGELHVEPAAYVVGKHDHLVLATGDQRLVFTDPRMFGRVQFARSQTAPDWWTQIAPAVLSDEFTVERLVAFLQRRRRAPIKAVLLMQEQFPGVGNWMADEILWRAAIHPGQPAGSLPSAQIRTLWRECRRVCHLALDTIAGRGATLPRDLNVHIPDSWLFNHRWEAGGRCPKTGAELIREEIGGRTTCWSPGRQKLAGSPTPKGKASLARKRGTSR